jgi:DHA2 family multidrug resistance protein
MTSHVTAVASPNYLTGVARLVSIISLSLATFLIVLDLSIANVSIPYISGDLGVAVDQGTYVITSFSVGNAIALPMTGWLTERVGVVRLISLSIISFVILSIFCGLSVSLPMLVISRFFQGLVAGPLVPLSQSLLLSTSPSDQKNRVLGIWSAVVVCGPVLGPILGGWITFNYSWPWIFFINVPTGIFCALTIIFYLNKFETPTKNTPVDKLGFFLLAISASSFQFVLDKGEQYDWLNSQLILTLSIVSFLGYLYFFIWEYFKKNPIVDLSLFRLRSYTLSLIFIIFMYSSYFGAIVIIPL